jgi:hypothetical protein
MKWNGCIRNRPWRNLRYNPGICLEGLGKTKRICQDRRPPGRDLSSGLPEYEAGVLTTLS